MREALAPQDHLYTLVERDRAGESVRVVGSVVDYRHAPSDPQGVLARPADPGTRIVSLTVTDPNSMVDRITPATTDELRAHVRAALGGVEDAWP